MACPFIWSKKLQAIKIRLFTEAETDPVSFQESHDVGHLHHGALGLPPEVKTFQSSYFLRKASKAQKMQ